MYKTGGKVKSVETIITAQPAPGMTLLQLKEKLEALGNPIVEVNHEKNYIKMIHKTESPVKEQ